MANDAAASAAYQSKLRHNVDSARVCALGLLEHHATLAVVHWVPANASWSCPESVRGVTLVQIPLLVRILSDWEINCDHAHKATTPNSAQAQIISHS